MKHRFLPLLFLVCATTLSAQQNLTLDSCRRLAVENYPLIKQYDLVNRSEAFAVSTIMRHFLPQLSLNAQATYQTDVTTINLNIPQILKDYLNFPQMSKDQYRASLDLSQVIYDGGAITSQRKIAKASADVERSQIDVSLYGIKGQIDQLYFGILSLDEQLRLLDLIEHEIRENRKMVESFIRNGVVTDADLDLVDLELLKIAQTRTEQTSARNSFVTMLGLFIDRPLDVSFEPIRPESSAAPVTGLADRPELRLLNAQTALMDARQYNVTSKIIPTLGLFVQGGYGRPGLNMLDNTFRFYAIGGVRLSWNIGNLYSNKNEKQSLLISKNAVELQREAFKFNTNLELVKKQDEISKFATLIAQDDEMITLRERIKRSSESKYRNGVYQLTDLLNDITSENRARQMRALHEIQHLMAIQNYRQIQGE